eukprot:GHVR01044166.1.p3 GENE.GHVR01044166.1~~GHVR01044166.1.p3  ORF type:complete len:167 (-),score=15.12 GHVR01044166.1:1253-1753(-)
MTGNAPPLWPLLGDPVLHRQPDAPGAWVPHQGALPFRRGLFCGSLHSGACHVLEPSALSSRCPSLQTSPSAPRSPLFSLPAASHCCRFSLPWCFVSSGGDSGRSESNGGINSRGARTSAEHTTAANCGRRRCPSVSLPTARRPSLPGESDVRVRTHWHTRTNSQKP